MYIAFNKKDNEPGFYNGNHEIILYDRDGKHWGSIYFHRSISNCKLAFLENVRDLNSWTEVLSFNEDEILKFVKEILYNIPYQVKIILLTVNNNEDLNFIKKYFNVVSIQTIPIGYGDTNQYHIYITTDEYLLTEDRKKKISLKVI